MNFDEKPELNITPVVDVMLVLVAILMLTTPAMLYEESITVPKGSKTVQVDHSRSIEIFMSSKKEILIGKDRYEFESFADTFLLYANQFETRDHKILIRADKSLLYADVVYILKSVKAAKFSKISLVTE